MSLLAPMCRINLNKSPFLRRIKLNTRRRINANKSVFARRIKLNARFRNNLNKSVFPALLI